MPRKKSVPSYPLHKKSNQAIVTLTNTIGLRKDSLRSLGEQLVSPV